LEVNVKSIVLDFETYYDQEYSLRKMTPVEYILDPRFECIGCAVEDGDKAFWLTPDELRTYLKALPPKVAVISHNALFDMCILAWVFDYTPALMIDTLGMARAWLGYALKSLSLNSVAMHLGLGVKGDTVHKVIGMSAAAIRASGMYDSYAKYSINDAVLCRQIYRALMADGFPVQELAVNDMVLRCAVSPKLQLDQNVLAGHLALVQIAKQGLLERVGLSSRDDLMSNERFATALRMLGVEPPTKISALTGKETYAFSKTDVAFMELEEHHNPQVQSLVAARLGIKSTLEETRTNRLLSISHLTWPGNKQRLMPIPLRYSGAHTHRLSGDWKLNMQNLPRGGALRKALVAPDGHKIVAADASQIEARLVAWFCGQKNLVEQFAKGEDVYSSFASTVFGKPINKKDHPDERFIGKTAILGMGYGVGWVKFQKTVQLQSKAQTGKEIILSDDEAQRIVTAYRETYPMIPLTWKKLQNTIPQMTSPNCQVLMTPLIIGHEHIKLPSGLYLRYHGLQNVNNEWTYTFGGKPKRIYGGAMLENIIQSLARILVMDAAVGARNQLAKIMSNADMAMQIHDELVFVVPDELARVTEQILLDNMTKRPSWGLDIPLAAEAGIGQNYGEAK
jgi:DNA polymerase